MLGLTNKSCGNIAGMMLQSDFCSYPGMCEPLQCLDPITDVG